MSAENESQSQSVILMTLGELKGQMASIQSFLTSHAERMTRQEERSSDLEKKTDAHVAAIYTQMNATAEKQNVRIQKMEVRAALWLGGVMVVIYLIKIGFDAYVKMGMPAL